ncbi:unnamed protein product [Mytilus edulis]|uniref:Uncharacterized protein n=1 Tax=Mytilus edulis TaxID=6550 RepID=A0A8S3RZ40_MYTED|nr:unnamed protein product [Mytilus edulis]
MERRIENINTTTTVHCRRRIQFTVRDQYTTTPQPIERRIQFTVRDQYYNNTTTNRKENTVQRRIQSTFTVRDQYYNNTTTNRKENTVHCERSILQQHHNQWKGEYRIQFTVRDQYTTTPQPIERRIQSTTPQPMERRIQRIQFTVRDQTTPQPIERRIQFTVRDQYYNNTTTNRKNTGESQKGEYSSLRIQSTVTTTPQPTRKKGEYSSEYSSLKGECSENNTVQQHQQPIERRIQFNTTTNRKENTVHFHCERSILQQTPQPIERRIQFTVRDQYYNNTTKTNRKKNTVHCERSTTTPQPIERGEYSSLRIQFTVRDQYYNNTTTNERRIQFHYNNTTTNRKKNTVHCERSIHNNTTVDNTTTPQPMWENTVHCERSILQQPQPIERRIQFTVRDQYYNNTTTNTTTTPQPIERRIQSTVRDQYYNNTTTNRKENTVHCEPIERRILHCERSTNNTTTNRKENTVHCERSILQQHHNQ